MLVTVEAKNPPSSPHLRGDHEPRAPQVKFSASRCTIVWLKYLTCCEMSGANPPADSTGGGGEAAVGNGDSSAATAATLSSSPKLISSAQT